MSDSTPAAAAPEVVAPAAAAEAAAPAAAAAEPAAAAAAAASESAAAPAEEDKVEEADSTAEYQAVVQLKPVEVSTGEEQDETLYKQSVAAATDSAAAAASASPRTPEDPLPHAHAMQCSAVQLDPRAAVPCAALFTHSLGVSCWSLCVRPPGAPHATASTPIPPAGRSAVRTQRSADTTGTRPPTTIPHCGPHRCGRRQQCAGPWRRR